MSPGRTRRRRAIAARIVAAFLRRALLIRDAKHHIRRRVDADATHYLTRKRAAVVGRDENSDPFTRRNPSTSLDLIQPGRLLKADTAGAVCSTSVPREQLFILFSCQTNCLKIHRQIFRVHRIVAVDDQSEVRFSTAQRMLPWRLILFVFI